MAVKNKIRLVNIWKIFLLEASNWEEIGGVRGLEEEKLTKYGASYKQVISKWWASYKQVKSKY